MKIFKNIILSSPDHSRGNPFIQSWHMNMPLKWPFRLPRWSRVKALDSDPRVAGIRPPPPPWQLQ